jgi:cyclic beta-1,2-glucan synthetase
MKEGPQPMELEAHVRGIVREEELRYQRAASAALPQDREEKEMDQSGQALAATLSWLPGAPSSDIFAERCQALSSVLKSIQSRVANAFSKAGSFRSAPDEGLLWLRDNAQELSAATSLLTSELGPLTELPMVAAGEQILPRVLAIAEGFIKEAGFSFSKREFTAFCMAFEEATPLEYHEIGALVPALRLVLLEQIAGLGEQVVNEKSSESSKQITWWIQTFRHVVRTSWKNELESLIPFDKVLREDPIGAYGKMDLESRNIYRERVAHIARRSDRSETQVAKEALALAQRARGVRYSDPRIALRESHIGYYLVGEGSVLLCRRVGFHPGLKDRFQALLRSHPDDVFLGGIAACTVAILAVTVWALTPPWTPLLLVLISTLVLLLPGSQAAVQLMNYLLTNALPAQPLFKLDFSESIPDDCVTLVAVPTLLLNEEQVRRLVEELEVRYLGNHDRNIHFAIVSDLPDSHRPAPEDSALVALCSKLIEELNARYLAKDSGTFFHLHRYRTYNPHEKGWMGWERKRGKLHDLNQLLRGYYDAFPVKTGNLKIFPRVRYVITLDSDTELPRGSARRMIGTLAHPLNQAIIDPLRNVVVTGYGILQPRVGISVQSTTRSRLSALFAGETGLDPYTRAISDVYQDLYGEGSFAGKGIYEVDTMIRVLQGRFPRNALLSHDLIEGAYARAGLVTDIIVVEDYPSHYSAYNRRKHRWVRGDWQIIEWLLDVVPDESGSRVPNPISLVSRWKIFDNLRRSLVDPATFVLLLFGWLVMGHPVRWTIATICILFLPAWAELLFRLTRAIFSRSWKTARDAFSDLFDSNFTTLLGLTLLADQTMLSLDAIVRALVRRWVTRERLLEWETAEEAELGERRTPLDRYIKWMPFIAAALGLIVWRIHVQALPSAIPVLLLWACSQPFALWLNGLPIEPAPGLAPDDERFLRRSALHIWRYFLEFSSPEYNWLVPDNIQDIPHRVIATVSPTNIGLLLNARQVAAELGYITIPELVELTQKTLATISRLETYRGHLMNWYDTRTLQAKPPLFVSSVDSGNLVASLWTLEQGCLDRLRRPLLSRALADGLLDHLRLLQGMNALPRKMLRHSEWALVREDWLATLLSFPYEVLNKKKPPAKFESDVAWFREQAVSRVQQVRSLVELYLPWRLPEFAALRVKLFEGHTGAEDVPLERLPDLIAELELRLDARLQAAENGDLATAQRLSHLLTEARQNASTLVDSMRQASKQASRLAEAMDFSFLLNEENMQLSVGFDADSEELQPYYYDLLATEPRTAVFVSIAKEDIPQDCWFHLDRPYSTDHGHPVLLSWTGTMFEYMMPSIWLRSYPSTLLDRACRAAVRAQQEYAANKGIPWGISESACARRNPAGDYHYEAFGVPSLARKKSESDPLIVSPYSTFLALPADRRAAIDNLRKMDSLGWFGPYGFLEAADYTKSRRFLVNRRPELVHSWMVHHQGMSLLSLGNILCGAIVQRWFHSDRRVQATELLLQERAAMEVAGR